MSDSFNAQYFTDIAIDETEDKAQQARRVVLSASGEDAEKSAKAANLAQDLGVPKQAVQYDLEHYEREKNFGADYFTRLGSDYPTMIDFVSDPDNASIVHDDMTYLEKTAKTLVQVPGQVKEGYYDVHLGNLRNKQMYGAASEEEIAYANQLSQRQRTAPEPTGFISDTALKVAQQLPILGAVGIEAMGYSVAAGGAALGVGMLTAPVIPEEIITVPMSMRAGGAYGAFNASRRLEGGLAFDEFLSFKDANGQGIDEDVARGAAMIVGITNGAVELIPLKKLAETVPGIEKLSQYFTKDGLKQALKYPSVREALSDIGQRYAKAIVAEGSTEIAQEAVTMYTGELIKAIDDGEFDTLSIEEQVSRLAEAGKAGAQVAAGLGFAGTAVRTGQVIAEQTGQPNPMNVAEYVRNARETLADSGGKLMTRSKPKMREYIDGVTQGQTFYLDAGATSALYQKMSEEQKQQIINAIPDFEASLDGAVRTKDSFEIPAADFFTYIQPFDEAGTLDEYVTLSPEHYSAADLNEIDEMISDLMDEAQALEEHQTDGDVVESNIYQQLLQNFNGRKAPSGRVDVARLMSQNPRAFYETMLDRSNQDPRVKEILDRLVRDVVIRRQVPNLQRVLKIDELDLSLDRVRDRAARRAAAQEAGQSPDMFGRVQTKKRKGKAKPTPVISWLGKRVGIRPGGAAARELAAMDITPKSHPRLFKAKGIGSVDNIPASEFNDEIGNQIGLIAQEDENGYVDQEWLLEQLRNESFGEGALTQEQMDAETEQAYLDDIEQVMQMVGVDLDMPNADIKAELQRYQDELAQDFDNQRSSEEFFQSVFHGSPYNFDKFTLEHIGKGEGNQAYGYGLYFTDRKAIAEYYKDSLGQMRVNGKPATVDEENAYSVLQDNDGNIQKAITDAKSEIKDGIPDFRKEILNKRLEILKLWEKDMPKISSDGQLYEVNIPENDVLLLWEKPLSEQPEIVQKALREILPQIKKSFPGFDGENATGAGFYAAYQSHRGNNAQTVSETLSDLGVKGTKYLDGQSRANGEGAYNYVIYDDSSIEVLNRFYQGGEDARGSIEFTPSGQSIIRLFEKEDLSTFMHEAGHLYWRAMSEIAALDNAPEQIAQDVATVRAWVGAKDGATLTVEQEEQIADAFLEYIRKGDAPSVDLQSAFQRMKGWLMRIYRGVRDTLPKINKDISDVFDRMLATDDAIERVRTEPTFRIDEAILSLLPKAQADRMRKKYEKSVEHAKERILKKAIMQAESKATKTYKEERTSVQARITKEVEQERTYAAMDKILEEGGLSRKGVTQVHGKEAVPYLSGHGGLVKKGGQHPDVYADLLGYSNGYEMLMDFMNAEKKKDRINRLTDQAMLERYGDMLNDGSIDDEAMRIYHNRLQKEVIALEMKALAELGSIPAPDPDGIEAAAIKLVGDLQISKLQPGRYLRAENRAYFDYGKALGQGNYARAARAKAQQLLNHHMYVMTADARETVEKSVKGWRRFGRPDKKIAKAKSINIDYVYAIRAILARHDIGRSDFAFNDWFEQLRAESPDSAQTLAQLINMNTEGAKPYKDLSVDEFMGLKDSIEGLIELGRDTLKIELDGKRLTAREAAQAAADTIYDNNKERDMSKHYEGLMDKARELVAGFDVSVTRMEFILKALEGNEVNGKLAQMFINPLAKAEAAEQAMHQDIAEKFREIIKKNGGVGNRWKQKVYDQRLDGSFTVRNIVTIALNMGNEGNLEKLLDGYNWEYADVKAIVERYLTKEDMDTVQEIWDLMEQLRPDLQRVHKEVTGFPMEIVKAQPLETKWGTYKGGYFPVVYDVKRSDVGARNAEDVSVFESNFTIPSVGKGMTKSRSSFSAPVDLDFESIVSGHFAKTIHLITHGTAVKDLNRIILNPIFKEAILNTAGVQVYSQFKPWLQAVAANRVYDNPVKAQDKVVRHLRVATTNLFLGFSVTTGIKQTLGMTATYASVLRGEVTQKNFFKSLRQYYTSPASMSKFVMENSAEMQGRIRKMDANVAMVMSSVSKLNTTYDKVMYAGMAFNSYSQMYTVDMPTWIAGYNQGMEKHAGNHEQAVNYADALVRQTQGSGAVKDLSVFQRGTETEKAAWAMFGTYIIGVLYPKLRELGIDTTRGHVARSAMALTSLLFVPAVLEGLMSDPPDDDEGLLEWTLLKSMLYGASSLPIIGGIVQGYAGDFGYSMSAIESPINMVIKNIQSDDPEKFTKGIVVGVGLATKLPVYKPYQALDELIDQASGEEDVNISELLQIVKDSDR